VLLPDHPGSDFSQQQSMLAGDTPPPGPEELRLRPLDVSALIDAVRDGRLLSGQSIDTNSVAMIGTPGVRPTSLQIAGGRPTRTNYGPVVLIEKTLNATSVGSCNAVGSSGIEQAAAPDPRVKAVVAVSPPLRLLFDPTSSKSLSANVLWSVERGIGWFPRVLKRSDRCVKPVRFELGHRLVLVKGADTSACAVFVEKSVQH
jgi:predicted dienelactone hydrolase